jgi:hypothetical protein
MHAYIHTHIHTDPGRTLSAAGQLPISALRSGGSPKKPSHEDASEHSQGGSPHEDALSNGIGALNNGAKDAGGAVYVYETPRDPAVSVWLVCVRGEECVCVTVWFCLVRVHVHPCTKYKRTAMLRLSARASKVLELYNTKVLHQYIKLSVLIHVYTTC